MGLKSGPVDIPLRILAVRKLPIWSTGSVLFQMLEFVLDDLLELACVGSHHAPAVYEQRRRAVDVQELAVRDVRVDRCGRLLAGHASLELVRLEPGLPGIVDRLVPDGRS